MFVCQKHSPSLRVHDLLVAYREYISVVGRKHIVYSQEYPWKTWWRYSRLEMYWKIKSVDRVLCFFGPKKHYILRALNYFLPSKIVLYFSALEVHYEVNPSHRHSQP